MSDPGAPLVPPSGVEVPRFAGPDTFARLPRLDQVDHAGVAILGIPFDSGVSYRPGARFGPGGIRAGSKLLRPYHPALDVHPWDVHQVADAGDVTANPFDILEAVDQVQAAASALLARADAALYYTFAGGKTRLSLNVENVFNKKYWPTVDGDNNISVGAPVNARLTLNTTF